MDFDTYQKKSRKTAVYPNIGKNHIYPTLGIVGEAGEIANKMGKVMRDDKNKITPQRKKDLSHELGDILWFIAQLSAELKLSLNDIAKENIKKLQSRLKRGEIRGSGDNR